MFFPRTQHTDRARFRIRTSRPGVTSFYSSQLPSKSDQPQYFFRKRGYGQEERRSGNEFPLEARMAHGAHCVSLHAFATSKNTTRSLNMARLRDYDCIGFDLDHTFIQYRLDNLYPVSHQVTSRMRYSFCIFLCY